MLDPFNVEFVADFKKKKLIRGSDKKWRNELVNVLWAKVLHEARVLEHPLDVHGYVYALKK